MLQQLQTSEITYSRFWPTGRTTFVNTLCGKQVLRAKEADDAANAHLEEGVRIKPVTVGKANWGVLKLLLTI